MTSTSPSSDIFMVKVPLRASIIGGGTDIPDFIYANGEGACLSTSIDKYIYCVVKRNYVEGLASKLMIDPFVDTELTQAVLKYGSARLLFDHIRFFDDVPTKGTGLGSSAAWVMALRNAIKKTTYEFRAEDNFEIERSTGSWCGYQDHAQACAGGGLNFHQFKVSTTSMNIEVKSKRIDRSWLIGDNRIQLFYIGGTRDSSVILKEQSANAERQVKELKRLVELAQLGFAASQLEVDGPRILKRAMAEAWEIKKNFSSKVSNALIDEIYSIGCAVPGVIGGKLLGAGMAGYMMFVTEPHSVPSLVTALKDVRAVHVPVSSGTSFVQKGYVTI